MPTYQRHEADGWRPHRQPEMQQHVQCAPPATGEPCLPRTEHNSSMNQRDTPHQHNSLQIDVEHDHHHSHHQPQRRQPRTIQRTKSSPSLEHQSSLSSSASTRRTRRLQKSQATNRNEELAKQRAEAEWYLRLPDKVRRQHFSREERQLLSSRCDSFQLFQKPTSLPGTEEPPSSSWSVAPPLLLSVEEPATYNNNSKQPLDEASSPAQSRPHTASSIGSSTVVVDPVTVQRATSVRYFRPNDMASCFDPSHAKRARGHSLSRRTLSLSGASMRHSTSSIPPLLPSPIPPFSAGHRRGFSATPRKSESSGSTFDPNAVHYKDPQARAKLRTYLGSPQKFDEAVEFGFPSNNQGSHAGTGAAALELPADFLAPLTLSQDLQSFMNDDWLPFLEADDEVPPMPHADSGSEEPMHDDSSVPDLPSPVTPGDHEEIYHRAQRMALKSSTSSSTAARHHSTPHLRSGSVVQLPAPAPSVKHQPSFLNSYTNGGFGMREMTLRLTLTRPDLRAHEEELYGWQAKPRDDALALEELPVSEDTHGEMSPFGAGTGRAVKRESKSLKRYFTIRKDRKILGYAVG